jgi:hypothetical protein
MILLYATFLEWDTLRVLFNAMSKSWLYKREGNFWPAIRNLIIHFLLPSHFIPFRASFCEYFYVPIHNVPTREINLCILFSNGYPTSFWIKTFSTFLCLSLQNRSCTCLGTCSDRCQNYMDHLAWSWSLFVILLSAHLEEADLNFLKHWRILRRELNNSLWNILPWHSRTKRWLIWTEVMEINYDYISSIMKCYLFVSHFLLIVWMFVTEWITLATKKMVWSSCNFTYLFCPTIDFIKTQKRKIWQAIRDVSKMDRVAYWAASCVSVVKKYCWYDRIKQEEMNDTWSIFKRR